MTGALVDLIKLLFGQVGVIGTICLGLAAFVGWLLREERNAHLMTQRRYEELNEKRFEILLMHQKALGEVRDSLSILARAKSEK